VSQVEFGTFMNAQANVAESARRIESLGYDILGCGEHVSFYGPVTNSYITLAVAAGATTSIKLMSGIVLSRECMDAGAELAPLAPATAE
jgi:alkanesulfonate monooxygenase SsuD/methylene tetrahydromethanopterin reductase-like flavin-dependent oxidoreductase (luciferase family)